MSFTLFWMRLEAANPAMKPEAKVTLTTEQLQKQLRRAFEAGERYHAKLMADAESISRKPSPFEDMFRGFGF